MRLLYCFKAWERQGVKPLNKPNIYKNKILYQTTLSFQQIVNSKKKYVWNTSLHNNNQIYGGIRISHKLFMFEGEKEERGWKMQNSNNTLFN